MLNYAQKSYLSENYGTAVALICHASHGGSGHEQQRSLRVGRHIIFLAPRLFSGFPRLFDFAGTRLMALHIGFEPCGELLANPHLLIDGPARTPLLDLPCLALRPLLVQRGITSAFSRMRRISSLLRFRAYRTRAMPNMAIITIGMTIPANVLLRIYIK